jgi:hypothetical protein
MSLKDEIEKLIRDKRNALCVEDQERKAVYERLCEQFAPLKAMLEEIIGAIDPKYVQATFDSFRVTISLMKSKDEKDWDQDEWEIQPNQKIIMPSCEFVDLSGFTIRRGPLDEYGLGTIEDTFKDEHQVVERVIEWITTHIARKQHYSK